MTSKNIRHLPVLEDNRLIGMVSLGDLVRVIISQQDSKIHDLESYFRYRSDLL
jgi:CBS domain-containing protein